MYFILAEDTQWRFNANGVGGVGNVIHLDNSNKEGTIRRWMIMITISYTGSPVDVLASLYDILFKKV